MSAGYRYTAMLRYSHERESIEICMLERIEILHLQELWRLRMLPCTGAYWNSTRFFIYFGSMLPRAGEYWNTIQHHAHLVALVAPTSGSVLKLFRRNKHTSGNDTPTGGSVLKFATPQCRLLHDAPTIGSVLKLIGQWHPLALYDAPTSGSVLKLVDGVNDRLSKDAPTSGSVLKQCRVGLTQLVGCSHERESIEIQSSITLTSLLS